jgi:hypothetical protein
VCGSFAANGRVVTALQPEGQKVSRIGKNHVNSRDRHFPQLDYNLKLLDCVAHLEALNVLGISHTATIEGFSLEVTCLTCSYLKTWPRSWSLEITVRSKGLLSTTPLWPERGFLLEKH